MADAEDFAVCLPNGYGFVCNYLAEVFHLLRRLDLGAVIEEMVDLDAGGDGSKNAVK